MKQQTVILERHLVAPGDIPVLTCYQPGNESNPLVILQHGYTCAKETDLRFSMLLADAGYFVVMPDAQLHGERRPHDFRARFESDFLHTFLLVIEGTVADISVLLDYFRRDQAGMVGISMGGYITFLAAVREPRLTTVVPLIGSPVLVPPPGQPVPPESLARFDVMKQAQRIPPKALLVQNGEDDEIVPVSGVRNADPTFRALYAGHPDRYELHTYPGVGHTVTDEMRARTVEWLHRFLPVS